MREAQRRRWRSNLRRARLKPLGETEAEILRCEHADREQRPDVEPGPADPEEGGERDAAEESFAVRACQQRGHLRQQDK